ncbi:MAG: type III pantothenate kinase [Myxococcota bacterium]
MLLTVDIGNSHTVLGVFRDGELAQHFRLSTDRSRTEDEYGVLIRALLSEHGIEWEQVDDAIVASVVPPLTENWERLLARRLGRPPLVVGPGVKTGMAIRYENPREVGADRIVNGVAGYERFREEEGGPHGVVVVDFGTATTFDVISPKAEYLGGAIAPGVMISAEALFQRASKLPRVDLTLPESPVGKNTVSSMQAGILYGYIGLVDGVLARIRDSVGFSIKTVATGGVARIIAEHANIDAVDDELTLKGLRIIYGRNER